MLRWGDNGSHRNICWKMLKNCVMDYHGKQRFQFAVRLRSAIRSIPGSVEITQGTLISENVRVSKSEPRGHILSIGPTYTRKTTSIFPKFPFISDDFSLSQFELRVACQRNSWNPSPPFHRPLYAAPLYPLHLRSCRCPTASARYRSCHVCSAPVKGSMEWQQWQTSTGLGEIAYFSHQTVQFDSSAGALYLNLGQSFLRFFHRLQHFLGFQFFIFLFVVPVK